MFVITYIVKLCESRFTMKTKYGVVMATPVIILAGVYVAWAYLGRAWRKKPAVSRVFSRSVSMGAIHGGRIAVQRLINFHKYRADQSTMEKAANELKTLVSQEQPDFALIAGTVMKLEMTGREEEGVKILRRALEKARKAGKRQEAYEIEMLLVEMLIYQGEVEEALKCKCLDEKMITDGRRPLYKAISHIIRGDPEKIAEDFFNEFREIEGHYHRAQDSHDSEINKALRSFGDFAKVVESLQQDIKEAKTHISTSKS